MPYVSWTVFLMEEEFDDLLEQEEPMDDDVIADFFDAIPWCYDQYDNILQLFFVFSYDDDKRCILIIGPMMIIFASF